VRYSILGPLEVEHDGRPLPLGRRRDRAVLALLILADGRPVTVDTIVEALWANRPPSAARQAVHTHVSRLRGVLRDATGDTRIRRIDAGYILDTHGDWVDAREFQHRIDSARAEPDPAARAAMLRGALTLWRGDPLGHLVDGSLRERICVDLGELHRWTQEACLAADIDLGRSALVIGELRELAAEHPTRAGPHLLLMRALHRTGRRPEALAVFRRHRDALINRLGVEPEADLRALQREILLEDSAVGGPPIDVPAPRELPAAVPVFVGRHGELRFLDATLAATSPRTPAPGDRVVVISGPAGVGKTALAVQWAHRVAESFRDGQLYTDLRGFSAAGEPVDAYSVIRRFLLSLGIPPEAVPAEPVEMYRSVLSGRRMLLLFDNALDTAQVRPLLPGAGDSVVVVTSRHQLTPLLAEAGCRSLNVVPLAPAVARDLLARRVGDRRMADDPDGVSRIVERCGGLPLALALVAARATVRPSFRLSALAADLDGADLDGFGDGDTGLRAVLSWSYRAVGPVAARLLRRVARHPGPTVGVELSQSLLAASRREIRAALAELIESNLLTEPEAGRFGLHDLVRVFLLELSDDSDEPAEAEAIARRTRSHYLHTASAADRLIDPGRLPIALPDPEPGTVLTDLRDAADAHRWFDREHSALLALLDTAAADDPAVAWRLAWAMAGYQVGHGHWRDMLTCQHTALRSATEEAAPDIIALVHRLLGRAYSELGQTANAETHFRHALAHYVRGGDAAGEATVRMGLGFIAEQRKNFSSALDHAKRATELWRRLDSDAALAMALNSIGWAEANLGNYTAALPHCTAAVAISHRIGHVQAEAAAWDSLGFARHHLGEHDEAIRCYERAYALYRQARYRRGEAEVLLHLGDSRRLVGHDSHARQDWEHALTILRSLSHPLAADAQARLQGCATAVAIPTNGRPRQVG
jgi:DNA-binding SARP family transcriptional activator/tetratricopeptide (TPR) repeat protein